MKPTVGLDIGSCGVRVVEIEGRWFERWKLRSFGIEKIEEKASEAQTVEAIKSAFRKTNSRLTKVNIALSGQDVVVRYIHLPKMTKRDLISSLKFEADKYIPYKLNEVVVDYHILKSTIRPLKKHMAVLLVAAKRNSIEERVQMVGKAGLGVHLVDVDSFALINAFKLNHRAKEENLTALLNIGAKMTNVNIMKDGVSHFSRDILIGGSDLTRTISEKLNVGLEEAEKLKCSPTPQYGGVFETMRISLNNLVNELRLSFDYCEKQVEESIGKVYLTGGGSRLKDLDEYLKKNLGVEVKLWDPTAQLALASTVAKEELKRESASLAVGIGLALAERRMMGRRRQRIG